MKPNQLNNYFSYCKYIKELMGNQETFKLGTFNQSTEAALAKNLAQRLVAKAESAFISSNPQLKSWG
jgi:hypothetical protein